MLIKTYDEFKDYINEFDIVPFSNILEGWPSLADKTRSDLWHTDDDESDPWRWKDIAAEQRDCAYGCLLGGYKGFVSRRALPMYLSAVSPGDGAEGLWRDGLLSAGAMQVYNIIEQSEEAMIFDIRRKMGASRRKGASAVDTALRKLQSLGLIVVSGSRRRLNAKGLPYGWRCNCYMTVENWAGDSLLQQVSDWERGEARDSIVDMLNGAWGIERAHISKLFGF